MASNSFPQNTV